MSRRWRSRLVRSSLTVLALLLLAAPAVAQFGEAKGNLYGRVLDEQGGPLPGVSVTLNGPGVSLTQTSDARGEYRFLNLPPGRYTLTFALAGFGKVTHENVAVNLGANTNLTDTMKFGSVEASV